MVHRGQPRDKENRPGRGRPTIRDKAAVRPTIPEAARPMGILAGEAGDELSYFRPPIGYSFLKMRTFIVPSVVT
jgi:hypothetical protein